MHLVPTEQGRVWIAAQFFVMSEVAASLFHENPTVFGKVRLSKPHLNLLGSPRSTCFQG
jgi:hypothetical protein